MSNTVKFLIKKEKDIYCLELYRPYAQENGEIIWSYIDSFNSMTSIELNTLKNFLQEYLYKNDWD